MRFLAEPPGHAPPGRDPDITNLRVEKTHRFSGRDVSVFVDLCNLSNANPAQNLQWSSGTAFNRPLSSCHRGSRVLE